MYEVAQDGEWWRIHRDGRPYNSNVFATQEEAEQRIAAEVEYDRLNEQVEAEIGQERHYGVRVWSEPRDGDRTPTWRRTDPHQRQDGFAFAWYTDTPPPVSEYTRDQYERACAAVGIEAAPDSNIGHYGDQYGDFRVGEYPAVHVVMFDLRRRRMAGIAREKAVEPPVPQPPVEFEEELCDECGGPIVKGSMMRASLGLACDVDCYDAMESDDRRGRYASRKKP